MDQPQQRETLGSRMGFLLLSAGCAIGIGNVWRFPYITGKYGGAVFVLFYLLFLVLLGLPIMVMEFSVGRAAQKSVGGAFRQLEPAGTKWHLFGYIAVAGNYLLMMFYTTVAGWMLSYCFFTIKGDLTGLSPVQTESFFSSLLASPGTIILWMLIAVAAGFSICAAGLRNGVERVTKIMMSFLFIIMLVLVIRSVTLPGAEAGIEFYLRPRRIPQGRLWETIYAAMGQAFFTLSIGIGSMTIFGSYIGRDRSLTGESLHILALDTVVALMAGLIIFPASFAFGVDAGSGPGLIFITLPNIFNEMPAGRFWASLFFIFMSFAAMSTVIAVFENIMAFAIDVLGTTRKKAALVNGAIVALLSLPCALGFNVFSNFQPFGKGTSILDLEDFIVSNNLLPLGSMVFLFFCCYKKGWGWNNFLAEADTGSGLKFPGKTKLYVKYILPLIVFVIFIFGYAEKFIK